MLLSLEDECSCLTGTPRARSRSHAGVSRTGGPVAGYLGSPGLGSGKR